MDSLQDLLSIRIILEKKATGTHHHWKLIKNTKTVANKGQMRQIINKLFRTSEWFIQCHISRQNVYTTLSVKNLIWIFFPFVIRISTKCSIFSIWDFPRKFIHTSYHTDPIHWYVNFGMLKLLKAKGALKYPAFE